MSYWIYSNLLELRRRQPIIFRRSIESQSVNDREPNGGIFVEGSMPFSWFVDLKRSFCIRLGKIHCGLVHEIVNEPIRAAAHG